MTVQPWHPWLRGWLAYVVALAALPVGAVFLVTSTEPSGMALYAWQIATALGLLLVVRTRRFRDRPGVSAGLLGPVASLLAPLLVGADDDLVVIGLVGAGLVVAAAAASVAEQPARMRETRLPSRAPLALTGLVSLVALGGAASIALAPEPEVTRVFERLGVIEIPALPTVVRERLGRGPDELEVTVASTAATEGGAVAHLTLARGNVDGLPAAASDATCTVEVGPMGRTVELLASADAFELRWPISPHGETFGHCTYARSSLVRMEHVRPAGGTPIGGALFLAPLWGLLVLGLAWPLRRQHRRIDRSPELRVREPGVAVMPDGSPALVPAEIPMGSTVVALRIADVRPDYRSDARVSVEEHAVGEKPSLLVDLARRVRTLELLALTGAAFFLAPVLAAWLLGAALAF